MRVVRVNVWSRNPSRQQIQRRDFSKGWKVMCISTFYDKIKWEGMFLLFGTAFGNRLLFLITPIKLLLCCWPGLDWGMVSSLLTDSESKPQTEPVFSAVSLAGVSQWPAAEVCKQRRLLCANRQKAVLVPRAVNVWGEKVTWWVHCSIEAQGKWCQGKIISSRILLFPRAVVMERTLIS